jgi:hypothetical protein
MRIVQGGKTVEKHNTIELNHTKVALNYDDGSAAVPSLLLVIKAQKAETSRNFFLLHETGKGEGKVLLLGSRKLHKLQRR